MEIIRPAETGPTTLQTTQHHSLLVLQCLTVRRMLSPGMAQWTRRTPSTGQPQRDGASLFWHASCTSLHPLACGPGTKNSYRTFVSSISGTALAPTAPLLTSTFDLPPDASSTIPPTYYPIFTWTLSAGAIPLILLPVMETYGIRLPYLLCLLTLILTTLPQALAPPSAYGLLLAIRILTGGTAGVLQNVTGGIIGDVWAGPRARSTPVALYIWALVAGLMIGPVVGGAITWGTSASSPAPSSISSSTDESGRLSWRWVPWTQLIAYTLALPLIYALLPETRGTAILARRRRATKLPAPMRIEGEEARPSPPAVLKNAVGRPLRMLLTEPLIFCSALWSAFCFGNALLFTQSIPRVYGQAYGWEAWRCGLVQGALVVGVTLGLALSPIQDRWYAGTRTSIDPEKEEGGREGGGGGEEHFLPEARLYLSVPASFLGLAGGLFVYAWTATPEIHWMAPTAGLGLVGVGIFAVVAAASNYVEDSYSLYAASALAGVAFGENLTGAFLPLAEQALYTNLGVRWASSLLALVAVGLSFAPVVLLWKGKAIRARSPFIREAMYEMKGSDQRLTEH